MKKREKKAQVTIFLILGIVIVAVGVLVYIFYPQIKSTFGFESKNPSQYIQECMQEGLEETLKIISEQGGSFEPGNYILYKDQRISYLCYTNEYYKPCVMQEPNLKEKIRSEIYKNIKDDADLCFDSMIKSYENSGYDVSADRGEIVIELLPKRVAVIFNSTIVLRRDDTERYNLFNVVLNNNLYELESIAESILNWEAKYGNSETTNYMALYPDLKVEKYPQTDGTRIYIITNRDNGNKFQFASRSYAFPAGY